MKAVSELTGMVHFTIDEAKEYLIEKKKKTGYFFWNVYGWSGFLTLKPSWCTPSGKHPKIHGVQPFPRRVKISDGFGLGAVERQPVRWENCAKPVLCVCGG